MKRPLSRSRVRGSAMVEYIVGVGVIALAGAAAFDGFYEKVKDLIGREASCATGDCDPASAGNAGGGDPIGNAVANANQAANGGGAAQAPQPESDAQKLERLIQKQQRGERMTPDEIAFYDKLGATANKGIVTLSAGVAASVKNADGRFVKYGAELNSDKGAILTGKVGAAQALGKGKIEGAGDANSNGDSKLAGSGEVPLYGKGPAKVVVGAEVGESGLSSVYAKAGVEKGVKTAGGEVKVEAYAKAALNKLTPAEQSALAARMASRAAQMGNTRADNLALFQLNQDRVSKGLPPVDSLPAPAPAPAGGGGGSGGGNGEPKP